MLHEGHTSELHAIVADDEPHMRELLAGVLSREGFRVSQAANGVEVLDMLRDDRVDVLVSDILMPGLDGLAVIELARQVSPHTASVLITGQASLRRAREATQGGAGDFLPKPFSQREFVDAVNGVLERKHNTDESVRQRGLADLFELSQAAGEVRDYRSFLELSLSAAVSQTRSDLGWVAVREEGRIRVVGAVPSPTDDPKPVHRDSILRKTMDAASPLLMCGSDSHPLANEVQTQRPTSAHCPLDATEALAFPITASGETLGALAVARTNGCAPFTRGDFQLLSVLASQAGLLIKNAGLLDDLERAYVGTVRAMALMVEARDRYTHGHSRRVVDICGRLGRTLELGPEDASTLEVAAGLHDIGKVAVPDGVLNKPDKLTDKEWLAIRLHPVVGAEVLSPAAFLADARPLVLHHHERYDGRGYPDGLDDDAISLMTHIIIAADAWDAMTSHRPYRPALGVEQALGEIEAARGTQFHPQVANALVGMYAAAA